MKNEEPFDLTSLKELEKRVGKTRNLVRFIKKLSGVLHVEDLMRLLRDEVRSFSRVKEPILAYAKSRSELFLLFFQRTQPVPKIVPGVWQQQHSIRVNDVNDSLYLANIFGRPFGKLLTFPLKLKRKSTDDPLQVSAVLFFEHALVDEDTGPFLQFIEERLLPISIALDRLLLEQDLNEASLLWERTFDGLQDPVAIFDSEGQVLRANRAFSDDLSNVESQSLFSDILRHKDRLYEIHSYPISLEPGARPTNIINHYVDVTSAHRLQKQMIQNEKMAALGHLAGHIAHELNNPLTGIRSLSQVLLSQTQDRETLNQDLKEVEHAAERCQIIIKNLLDFSSGGWDERQVRISANEILNRTLPLLKTLISRFELNVETTQKNCDILVEPHLMQQVLFNIIKNAAQAMGDSGRLSIRTEVNEAADQVLFRVQDSGEGISLEVQAQMFDYFFTTKSQGQGTGLGLSMSKSIVDRFKGTIEVKSEIGVGSEFVIKIPHVPERP